LPNGSKSLLLGHVLWSLGQPQNLTAHTNSTAGHDAYTMACKSISDIVETFHSQAAGEFTWSIRGIRGTAINASQKVFSLEQGLQNKCVKLA
jgi:hypothetical protein